MPCTRPSVPALVAICFTAFCSACAAEEGSWGRGEEVDLLYRLVQRGWEGGGHVEQGRGRLCRFGSIPARK